MNQISKIFLILTFIFLTSCAPSQKKIQNIPNVSEQAEIKSNFLTYLKALEELNSFQGLAEIKLKTRGRSYSASEVVQIHLPNQFNLESLDDLGNLLFLLKSDGEHLLFQDLQANEKKIEKLSPTLVRQFLPFQSSIAQTLGLFFGKLALPQNIQELKFEKLEENPNHFWISAASSRYLWDEELKRITLFEEYKKNKLIFSYEASDFKILKSKNITLPYKIRLKDFARGSEMGIHYSNMEINVQDEDAKFEIKL